MWGVCLVTVVLATAAQAKNTYVVIMPSAIRPGLPISISVNVLQASGDVQVRAELWQDKIKELAHGTAVMHKDIPGLVTIQIPAGLKSGSQYKVVVKGSGGLIFLNETAVTFKSKSISMFVQTDKAMYKPGQTVNFRVFAMHPDLKVYHGGVDIDVYDPNSNKIKQMRNIQDASGVITSKLELSDQPVLGDWKIKVSADGQTTEKVITIAEYVLPKFKVSVTLPPFSLSSDADVRGNVKATYTYGKSVKGSVKLRAKFDRWQSWMSKGPQPMIEQTIQMNSDSTSFTIPMSILRQSASSINGRTLLVEANVTESLTGITLGGNSTVKFYDTAVKIEFLKSNPKNFKPGLPYTAYVKVEQQDGTPVTGRRQSVKLTTSVTYNLPGQAKLILFPRTGYYKLPELTFVVPDNGIIPLELTVPTNATQISLSAIYDKMTASVTLKKSWSPSDSYIQLFLKTSHPKAGSSVSFEVQSTSVVPAYTYQVLSRGSIVAAGSAIAGSANSRFSIQITPQMAPNARIVVYYVRTDGEIVTDSISFDAEGAFENKVSISFSKTKAEPGESVDVRVTATPKSSVNLLAVDQSVMLLKSGNDVTEGQVIDELKSYDTISTPVSIFRPWGFGWGGGANIGRKKRMVWWPYPVFYGGSDATDIFNKAGVKVMTDALLYHHNEPIYYPLFALAGVMNHHILPGINLNNQDQLQSADHVRKNFPETWLWTNTTTGYTISLNCTYDGFPQHTYIHALHVISKYDNNFHITIPDQANNATNFVTRLLHVLYLCHYRPDTVDVFECPY